MPYEYLASVQSAVRRINERIKTISTKLGDKSTLLNNYESLIDVMLPDNTRMKNGVVQIHTPSDIYKDPDKMEALKHIEDSIKTWGELRKDYEPGYERYLESGDVEFMGDKVTLEEYINVTIDLPQALVYLYSASDTDAGKNGLEIMGIKGRRKTYQELNKAIKDANKAQVEIMTRTSREKRYGVRKPARPRVKL